MGRHSSMPDGYGTAAADHRPRRRGRTVAIATALVLIVAAGTAVALRTDLLNLGDTCEKTVHLSVAASPDIAPALRAAASEARKRELTSDGNCLDVAVSARDSSKVADALRSGKDAHDFQVWVPDADLWIKRVEQNEKATKVSPTGTVATSPIGVGMVPAAAKSFGWPEKEYSWTELAGAALKDDTLRLGAADPSRSATGLLALTKLAAASHKAGDGDGTQAAAMAKILSQRTSDSDSQLMETVARDDSGAEQGNPRRNQALILSEQAAYAHNAEASDSGDLRLFYPKDGSPELNYPFTLVDETSLSTEESRAAVRFMTLLDTTMGHSILRKYGFRGEDGTTSDSVSRKAGARAPQPYAEPTTEPASDEEIEETLGMWTITVQSARVLTVVDASASMANPVPGRGESRMEVTKASMLAALSTSFTDQDDIGLWEFSTHLDGTRDYKKLVPTARLGDRKGSGTQRDRLSAAFTSLQPVTGGATGLYDTTLAAYKEARSTYKKGKFNAVVVVTDGVNEDPGSISRSTLVQQLQSLTDPERPVPLIAIAVGPDTDKDEIEQIAAATGGSGHQVSDPADIQKVILQAIIEAGAKSN
ncbi:substrate-binding and VWA domain-containing protein [Streptomyces sp. VRA16 Mangrove soil]|uniref:substrate-binding and VWA domain-containing protein n=1 Tax=Streptomyces sp. VRA16 Mangrove soil TaxID=2817434 RepID=UPI001A9CDD2D|nr:substrate-binding and VWA domain-containing protein [Streptomyces sp. VRA16 Mangrove soil]MBO1337309.1 VWA domain-containing protein [Streptomyces sp. VRA16 Mangrove soil]